MTIKGIEPDAPDQQHQETVVTHGPNQDTTERRSVGGPPAAAVTQTSAPAGIATSRTVVRDEVGEKRRKVAQITQIIWFAVGFLEVVLALRLVLKVLGAGQTADFTQMIMAATRPFVMPFLGIFPNAATDGFEFEPASVVAMVIYLLLGVGLVKLVRILYGETSETA